MQTKNITVNRRLAVFNDDYKLRMDVTIHRGDEFIIGKARDEFLLDDEGNLVMFVGEFSPHRISSEHFDLVDEVTVTTVKTYRRPVER